MLKILGVSPVTILLVVVLAFCLRLYVNRLRERSKIAQLGHFATTIPSYLPLGIDIAYRAVKHSLRCSDLQQWDWLFSHGGSHCKTVEFHAAHQRFILTADPENIKAILATQFSDYGKGPIFHSEWKDFLGDSIFTTDGELWHASRQLIRPQFIKERMKDLDIFEEHLQKVISRLGGSGEKVDIASLFYRYTLDSATHYLLGESVGSLERPQAEFAKAFDRVQKIQNLVARVGALNFLIPRIGFKEGIQKINAFVEPFIDEVLRINPEDLKEVSNQTFLQAMASSGLRDPQLIRDQVVAILLAGRDTTAGALSFLFLELSRNAEIWQNLRQEVLEKVGETGRPTYEILKDMPYLKNAINETLRLYPSVPFNVRSALVDTTLPCGGGDGKQPIGVLKGTPIGYSTLYMQRREDLYPHERDLPHPLEFRPERWTKWQPKPWQYIPFNGGPRICIGQQFALTEIGLVLSSTHLKDQADWQVAYTVVRILQKFDRIDEFTPRDGPQIKCEVVIAPANGVNIGLWESGR